MKIGLDIHGVIDHDPERFVELSLTAGLEIYIITGIKQELEENFPADLEFVSWHSIHAECEARGYKIRYDEKGRPWVDENLWDPIKADICKELGIDLMIDDSPVYGKYFDDIPTTYLHYRNPERTSWRDDGTRTDDGKWTFSINKPKFSPEVVAVATASKQLYKALATVVKPLAGKLLDQFGNLYEHVRAFAYNVGPLYEYNDDVNMVLEQIVSSDKWTALPGQETYYDWFVHEDGSKAKVWSGNKMYAYAGDGTVWSADGRTYSWRSKRAKRIVNQRLCDKYQREIK